MALITSASVAIISSCKKKDTTPSTPPAPANVLCDGNGSTSYYPLALNNSWTFTYYIATQSQSTSPNLVVTGTSSHNSLSYFKIDDQTAVMYGSTVELRQDAATHNIYYYDSNSGSEFMYVPATPTLNQSWAYTNGGTRKVTNLSSSISTGSCNYTGLIEITTYDSGSVLMDKEYFKKGAGMVHREDPDSFFGGFDKYNLSSITLH